MVRKVQMYFFTIFTLKGYLEKYFNNPKRELIAKTQLISAHSKVLSV